ncbi:hypothetical protein E4U24_002917 [Claviceps purpurea]|nr:hypothetical protein E4U11_004766 [Claviceps purpurea]KAG6188548.1 hypothetical protein E4U36_006701 [Claviceps purpurea]KAG6234488.1 hypothetical protein E4U26_000030 [Claviceps purpurea]KAG6258205.1 hypothetical protein E4U24_002917 [Claviceps purpurea]KAG6302808.1 hypothetical protein E4U45_002609 [Claviceps purpurea]
MAPKAKAGGKGNAAEPKGNEPWLVEMGFPIKADQRPPEPAPETVGQRTIQRFYQTNPAEKRFEEVGFPGLTPQEKTAYTHTKLVLPVVDHRVPLSNKAEREYWKQVTKDGLPIRRLRKDYVWGKDKSGRDIGTYKLEDFQHRTLQQARLSALDILHHQFLSKRKNALANGCDMSEQEIVDEKTRRKEMSALRKELYGQITGSLANDPEWDDVIPIPHSEPADALAQIAYPDDYAEGVSYLRAVMAAQECSPRCLRLTEHIISMNPAHYTVWLYRFKIVQTLQLPIPEEINWLNEVAMSNLKNYQIWHHRQLLMDHYVPSIASEKETVAKLARTEIQFVNTMLEEDAKNYHVWSYRQYLVKKLGMWNITELAATQNLIEDDIRNNSAWAHRFFLIFSDPAVCTADLPATAHDPKVPASVVDNELGYAKEKIVLAPQNQSSWNYLRGVLTKGGRSFSDVVEFSCRFVTSLGEEGEDVKSSHALEILADAYVQSGDMAKAKVCLQRLWEKWDPIREGYWKHRAAELEAEA